MTPAMLPVCNANCGAAKVACVELAAMVKSAERPPVENWIEGSSTGFAPAGANARFSRPVMATG